MRITNEYIKSLNPCKERHGNYLSYYKDTDFSVVEFIRLENISYGDKIWVWKKFATINEAAMFGLKCAESVLYIFEEKYPKDMRPRQALDAIRAFLADPSEENRQRCRDNAADAADAAAAAAADAAAYAAAAAADAADAYAAAYAADAADAYAAYAYARALQQNKNLEFLIEIYEGVK